MGIFDSSYKEDALKWREQKRNEDFSKLATRASGKFVYTMVDQSKVEEIIYVVGETIDIGFLEYGGLTLDATQVLHRTFVDVQGRVKANGLKVDNTYYPPTSILKVELEVIDG